MVKISRYILVIIGIIVLSISIPKLFWTIFAKVPLVPVVYYSCILDDFVVVDSRRDKTEWYDADGKHYTHEEFETKLPLMFFRQLIADGTMPDTINGVYMDPSAINKASSYFRYTPVDLRAPVIQLWPMFESESDRVNLEMPPDYFRIKESMEFIVSETNKVDIEKSKLFTQALKDKGFVFPADIIAGIPTTRKSCDEGYFITDSDEQFFHVKMAKGRPVVNKINIPKGLGIVYIECVDIKSKEFYCYLFTRNNGVFVVLDEVYDLQRLPVEGFNPYLHSLKATCDLFNKTFTHVKDGEIRVTAVDDMYEVVGEYSTRWDTEFERNDGKLFKALFPFEIKLTIPESRFVNFYLRISPGFTWIIVNFITLIIAIVILLRRGYDIKRNIPDLILVAITGIYGLASVLIFPNKFRYNN